MPKTTTDRTTRPDAATRLAALRQDGLLGLWGRLRHRAPGAYDEWLEERDMIVITATLLRLNDRQLARIGMQRSTLALDVDDLVLRCARERELGQEVLELVRDPAPRSHAIAAE